MYPGKLLAKHQPLSRSERRKNALGDHYRVLERPDDALFLAKVVPKQLKIFNFQLATIPPRLEILFRQTPTCEPSENQLLFARPFS